ncbi:DMT family transporter [Candidatus Fermentibacterales bacterium]|nr:DMT family transporter [Candidatus Fermentibacterales bacterium]
MNRYAITTMNYLMATSIGVALLLSTWWPSHSFDVSFEAFSAELRPVILEGRGSFSWQSSFVWALAVGVPAGVFYFLGFIYLQRSVRENGVGVTGSVAKLGILVPMTLSIVFWRELPTPVQWAGIGLAMMAILVATLPEKGGGGSWLGRSLVLLFLTCGTAEFTNKLFQRYAEVGFRSLFLVAVFGTALIVSAENLRRMRIRLTLRDSLTGLWVGIPNLFASWFLILALSRLNTSVVFTLYSAGSVVLITLGGVLLFGEQLRKRELAAICMTVAALLLINVLG